MVIWRHTLHRKLSDSGRSLRRLFLSTTIPLVTLCVRCSMASSELTGFAILSFKSAVYHLGITLYAIYLTPTSVLRR